MRFPFYIPSKGRADYMITSRVLSSLGVSHFIVVEPQEVDLYRQRIKEMNLLAVVLELDLEYKKKYELCDNLGQTKSTGPGPARNFAWDHAISIGAEWHWVMDDNIRLGGTTAKSQMLVDVHPDCSTMVFRFNRWHHYVDYGRFKKNQLIFKKEAKIETKINNYGMELKVRADKK